MEKDSILSSLADYPFSQKAVQYCFDVVEGKIPNCNYVVLACQGFIDLFSNENGWVYDAEKADRSCRFIQLLPHVKGPLAAKRELLILEPWQVFIVCGIFGWVDEDGLRKHQQIYLKIPRKNGKSILAAAIGLYMLVADGEYGAEVYSGATTEKQAWYVFGPAKIMAQKAEGFKEFYGIDVNAKTIVREEDFSKFEPVIGNPGDGGNPSCAIHDEYHEHKDSGQFDTMRTGMGVREQPIQLSITTAGSNLGGPCFEEERQAEKVLEGTIDNDLLFCVMYGIDPDDQWSDPACLKKANPNYGVSISEKFLLSELKNAIAQTSKQNAFRTKYLNQWVGAKQGWINILQWLALKRESKFQEFHYSPAHGAVDLASRKDVAAVCILWAKDDEFYTKQWFFVPESALENNDKYQALKNDGSLIVTPGNKTDQAFIEQKILELNQQYDLRSWAFDDYQGDYIMTRVEKRGLNVVNYGQTVKNMSAPMKEVEAQIIDKKLFHDGNACMDWMMGNVVFSRDAKDNIYPRKENDDDPKCKIDGPVSLIMCMGRMMADEQQGTLDGFLRNPLNA